MHEHPEHHARSTGAGVKPSVGAGVPVHRLIQIVRAVGSDWIGCLLRIVADTSEIAIDVARGHGVADGRFQGWPADKYFAPALVGSPDDGVRRDFRLEDRRYRLRLTRHPA